MCMANAFAHGEINTWHRIQKNVLYIYSVHLYRSVQNLSVTTILYHSQSAKEHFTNALSHLCTRPYMGVLLCPEKRCSEGTIIKKTASVFFRKINIQAFASFKTSILTFFQLYF